MVSCLCCVRTALKVAVNIDGKTTAFAFYALLENWRGRRTCTGKRCRFVFYVCSDCLRGAACTGGNTTASCLCCLRQLEGGEFPPPKSPSSLRFEAFVANTDGKHLHISSRFSFWTARTRWPTTNGQRRPRVLARLKTRSKQTNKEDDPTRDIVHAWRRFVPAFQLPTVPRHLILRPKITTVQQLIAATTSCSSSANANAACGYLLPLRALPSASILSEAPRNYPLPPLNIWRRR